MVFDIMKTETFSIPVVSAIIERIHNGEKEILVQTRWKPKEDPVYSGCIEIPGGKIGSFENVYDALKREVLEETGLNVIKIKHEVKTDVHSPKKDGSFAFVPFCCNQQIKGGMPWIGFAFICIAEDRNPKPTGDGTKDIRWMKASDLKEILEKTPEKIFTLHLGILDFYFNYENK